MELTTWVLRDLLAIFQAVWKGYRDDIAINGRFESKMAGHTRDGGNYEGHITNVCLDHEFPIPEGDAGLDGEEYPCAAPLLSEADRSGFERVAAAYGSASSGDARSRPI